MRSWFEPCGSWHVLHASRAGAWSQMIRPALFGVAAHAGFVDPVADLEQPDVRGPVRVVARRALHLALADRHVAEPLELGDLRLVTAVAGLRGRDGLELRVLRLRAVNGMARHAGQVARVVRTALPERVRRPVVARRTCVRGVAWRHRLEHTNLRLVPGFGVFLARAVAALAGLVGPRRRRPGVLRLAVQRGHDGLVLSFVACETGVVSGKGRGLVRRGARRLGGRRGLPWSGLTASLRLSRRDDGRDRPQRDRDCQER